MRNAPIVCLLLVLAGCQTYRRPVYTTNEPTLVEDDQNPYAERETKLVDATEEHPDDPGVWFKLGKFYENSSRLQDAIGAYQHLKLATEAKYPNKVYTGPDYSLGKVYARLGAYPEAVKHLGFVLKQQPEDPMKASLNRHFREAHLLLAAIYYDNAQWDPAEEHALAYLDLGGDEVQGERILMDIRYSRERDVRR